MKKIAILQSNYIPWKGYFDLINSVDEFIVYDTVQYTKNDWRNRNLIKTEQGLKWITIPVETSGRFKSSICDMEISNTQWITKHLNLLSINYRNSKYFNEVIDFMKSMYEEVENEAYLSVINVKFIKGINKKLNINTIIRSSKEFIRVQGKNESLINICKDCGTDVYLSGPAAKSYLDEKKFNEEGIEVEWVDYNGYPEYEQLFGDFEHGVSIVDLLFNVGFEHAPNYIKKR